MSLAGADSASWAIEESVGSDVIIMSSSFRGDCGGDGECAQVLIKVRCRNDSADIQASASLFRTANLKIW